MPSQLRCYLAWSWPIRLGLGALFIYSAVPKLTNLAATIQAVGDYNVLPSFLVPIYGTVLPFAELAVGISLLVGLFSRLAAVGGVALLVSFLIAIAINLFRGDRPECGCFGTEGSALDWTTLARDVGLMLGMGLVFLDPEHRFSVDRWISGRPLAGDSEPPAETQAAAGEPEAAERA